ncbi:Bug family tripartite tricarboxylate transporter substrate binding protein [Ramlibacter sp.]|uniref:Bug family tripartite tricarboxylate transporter substrate binding protein n=1 Tax=Ramlibacter sp. TaxID=1917967 RepID=UPI002BD2586C|nr:tripartite tricarboxylate transporter substrate-binding protein [Ramlibacter sp.]HWI83317.1 tripartite tricarboxylate transporter substrate-binding protein [Ramlibacter sp.]
MHRTSRRVFTIAACALAWGAGHAQTPSASGWPTKPIKVVVPSPPGGPPDLILRAILPKMSATLGQPIIVENRAGAGGMVGTAYVAKLPADGATWLFTTASHVNIPPFNENATYDPVKDFTHVTLAAQNFGQALVVHPDVPAKNVPELIAYARAHPGKLTYVNAGNGTASHIPAEVMKTMTATDILSVPYRGVAEGTTDLIAGRVDMFFVGTNIALQHVQSGKLRALALTGAKRWKGMPDVPTMDEQGLKGFSKVNWFGLWLPAGAPPEIVNRIQAAVARAVSEPDVRQQFDTLGLEGVAMKPDEFARFVADEYRSAQEIARRVQAGAKK